MDFHLWLLIAIFTVCMVGFGSSFLALALTGVPVVRTPNKVVSEICANVKVGDGDLVADAGCADARALVQLCKATGARGVGYELNGPVWLIGFLRVLFSGRFLSIRIKWKNFFRAELEEVNMVFCYLMPGSMIRIAKKCNEEMQQGSLIVSYLWPVPTWEPSQVIRVGPLMDPVYVYTIGDNPDPKEFNEILSD